MIDLLGGLLAFLVGLGLGTLVAGVAARLPLGMALLGPPVCVRTRQVLPWADALPLLGYVRRGGRCRACGLRLARWWPLTELGMGLLAVLAYMNSGGWNLRLGIYLVDLAVLLAILIMDWRRHEIYTVVLLAGVVSGGLGGLLLPEVGWGRALGGAVFGGGLMLALYSVARVVYFRRRREGLAWGDVELMAMLGLMVGFPAAFSVLFHGLFLGIGLLVFMLRRLYNGLQSYFPFAPGLCVAAMLWVLFHLSQPSTWNLPILDNVVFFTGKVLWDLARKALNIF